MLNGKLMFKSHLSNGEKEAVKKVAKGKQIISNISCANFGLKSLFIPGISPELGLKLLAPTPGASALIRSKASSETPKVENISSEQETKKEAAKSASQLLFEHKVINDQCIV